MSSMPRGPRCGRNAAPRRGMRRWDRRLPPGPIRTARRRAWKADGYTEAQIDEALRAPAARRRWVAKRTASSPAPRADGSGTWRPARLDGMVRPSVRSPVRATVRTASRRTPAASILVISLHGIDLRLTSVENCIRSGARSVRLYPRLTIEKSEASRRTQTTLAHHQRPVGSAASASHVATAMHAKSSVKTPIHHQFLRRAATSRPIHITGTR